MSKSLRALEGEVGVQLIRRSTRGVVCTPAGRAFLTHAGAIRAEVRKAEEELAELAAPGGGNVSVGFTPTVAAVAPEAIARFLDDHPLVRLRIMKLPRPHWCRSCATRRSTSPSSRGRLLPSVRASSSGPYIATAW